MKVTSNTKVKIINNTSGSLSFTDSEGMNHMFPRPNSYKHIEFHKILSLYNDYPNVIEEGYVIFEDKDVYKHLEVPENICKNILSEKEIVELLGKDVEVMKEQIQDLPQNIRENIAQKAKELRIDSMSKIKAIKDTTGFDITIYEE